MFNRFEQGKRLSPKNRSNEALKIGAKGLSGFMALAILTAMVAFHKDSTTISRNFSPPAQNLLVLDDDFSRLGTGETAALGQTSGEEPPNYSGVLETRIAGELAVRKITGNWSEGEINLLILGDRFRDENEFLNYAVSLSNQLFDKEPFASNREKFASYAVWTNQPYGCFQAEHKLCDDFPVRSTVYKVISGLGLTMHETMVIVDQNDFLGRSYLDGESENNPNVYSYSGVTSTAVRFPYLGFAAHEFAHSFGNLADEDPGSPSQPASPIYINCLDAQTLAERWRDIPGQPGAVFPGCSSTTDGYRDAENDLMREPAHDFGPVDIFQLKRLMNIGPGRYRPPEEPKLDAVKINLPIVHKNSER